MASVQEKNLSQVSRENCEKKLSVLTFSSSSRSRVNRILQVFADHLVCYSVDFEPGICRISYYPGDASRSFALDLADAVS